MKQCIIVRYNEIGTKGRNRSDFENLLARNCKATLKAQNVLVEVKRRNNRIIIYQEAHTPLEKLGTLKNVFGISSFSIAWEVENNLEAIKECLAMLLKHKDESKKSFRISARNLGNQRVADIFSYNKILGAFVEQLTHMKVSLKSFDVEYGIEISGKTCYVYDNKTQGYGGLPLGSQGTVYCLIEDEASIVAAWLMMKRGCIIQPLSLNRYQKFTKNILSLLVPFNTYKEFEVKHLDSREAIMDLIEQNKGVLVTGETFQTFKKQHSLTQSTILKPLIGKQSEDIRAIASTQNFPKKF